MCIPISPSAQWWVACWHPSGLPRVSGASVEKLWVTLWCVASWRIGGILWENLFGDTLTVLRFLVRVGLETFRPWLIMVSIVALYVSLVREAKVISRHLFSLQKQCVEEGYLHPEKGVFSQVWKLAWAIVGCFLVLGPQSSLRGPPMKWQRGRLQRGGGQRGQGDRTQVVPPMDEGELDQFRGGSPERVDFPH